METENEGMATPEELRAFCEAAGDQLVVIDLRNPDETVEPADQKSIALTALPDGVNRPQARNLVWDRTTESMPLPEGVSKETPIVTHCGAGHRGQAAKNFLEQHGYVNVLNGGGPKHTTCWNEYGTK